MVSVGRVQGRWRTWLRRLCVTGALATLSHAAQAVGADAWNTGFVIDFNEQWLRNDLVNRALSQAREDMRPRAASRGGGPSVKAEMLWTGPQTMVKGEFLNDSAIQKLAGMYPAAQRREGAAMFTQIIASFNANVEKLYQVPPENLATGVAALLAGSYAAYHNRPFPDGWVRPTVEQLGELLRRRPELFEGKTQYKRESYQMAVGIGMLLLTAQADAARKGADAPGLRRAGAQVLQAVLGAPPARIEFSPSGFRVR